MKGPSSGEEETQEERSVAHLSLYSPSSSSWGLVMLNESNTIALRYITDVY